MSRPLGFVVHTDRNLMHVGPTGNSSFKQTTLWYGGSATIFKSRRTAQAAIDRTKKYRRILWAKYENPASFWPWIDKAKILPVGEKN